MNLFQLDHNNIKIEDQILPNLDHLARVLDIQSSGSVNLKFLITFYTGDGSYNPIIKKFFKFWKRDVSTTPTDPLNHFFQKL